MPEISKSAPVTKLLWVDLEMTGLDVNEHVIIEVAAIVTDWKFSELATYQAIVYQPDSVLARANPWAHSQHTKSGLLDRVRNEGIAEKEVIHALADFIGTHFGNEPAVLAGNSIHNDRVFIRKWWPEVENLLHYRMLDVSSWKLALRGKYGVDFEKADAHLATEDIRASIAELEFYLQWLKDHSADI